MGLAAALRGFDKAAVFLDRREHIGLRGLGRIGTLTLPAIAPLAVGLTVAVLAFVLFAPRLLFALRLVEHALVMLGVLLEILGRHPVARKLRIAGKLVVLVDDLLRRAAHLALGAAAVEHTVDDVAQRVAVAVTLRPRA